MSLESHTDKNEIVSSLPKNEGEITNFEGDLPPDLHLDEGIVIAGIEGKQEIRDILEKKGLDLKIISELSEEIAQAKKNLDEITAKLNYLEKQDKNNSFIQKSTEEAKKQKYELESHISQLNLELATLNIRKQRQDEQWKNVA